MNNNKQIYLRRGKTNYKIPYYKVCNKLKPNEFKRLSTAFNHYNKKTQIVQKREVYAKTIRGVHFKSTIYMVLNKE